MKLEHLYLLNIENQNYLLRKSDPTKLRILNLKIDWKKIADDIHVSNLFTQIKRYNYSYERHEGHLSVLVIIDLEVFVFGYTTTKNLRN